MKVIIGSDHAGVEAKEKIKHILTNHNIEYVDEGAYSQEQVDYPDIAKKVCNKIQNTPLQEKGESDRREENGDRSMEISDSNQKSQSTPNPSLSSDSRTSSPPSESQSPTWAVLICGSGTGMQIAANKYQGIRAAFCYDVYSATMARRDNDANVITLRAREFDWEKYEEIIMAFLNTPFSKEQRHIRRIEKLK